MRRRQKLQFAPYHVQLQPHQSCRVLLPSLFTPVFFFFSFFPVAAAVRRRVQMVRWSLEEKKNSLYDFFNSSRQLMRHGKVVHWVKSESAVFILFVVLCGRTIQVHNNSSSSLDAQSQGELQGRVVQCAELEYKTQESLTSRDHQLGSQMNRSVSSFKSNSGFLLYNRGVN